MYAGDAGDATGARTTRGLYRAESLADAPELLTSAYPVQCLSYRASDATLFACDRHVFGTADLDSGELRPLAKLASLEHFVECPGLDVPSHCAAPMLQGYCGVTHFPCAPICDRYGVDLSDLESAAYSDPSIAACFVRRDPSWQPMAAGAANPRDASAPPPPAAATSTPPPAPPTDAGIEPRPDVRSGCRIGSQDERPTFGSVALLAFAVWLLRRWR